MLPQSGDGSTSAQKMEFSKRTFSSVQCYAIVYFGQFFDNHSISTYFCASFFPSVYNVLILTQNGLGYVWATFSQTHQVTLMALKRYWFFY
jgi:hypothetical protein